MSGSKKIAKNGENYDASLIYIEERITKSLQIGVSTRRAANNDGPVHKGIICDECENKIVGMRYKCLECHDFDLCMECEGKMVHKNHTMLRFYKPAETIDWSRVKFKRFVKKFQYDDDD